MFHADRGHSGDLRQLPVTASLPQWRRVEWDAADRQRHSPFESEGGLPLVRFGTFIAHGSARRVSAKIRPKEILGLTISS
ncbi:hypothetical protein NXC14_PA00215 (plasmid) [Rhizobium sp. NXC14]|nr:hypothetical protein NXC14_PA00215 [Rhizobium sp. NXC14]